MTLEKIQFLRAHKLYLQTGKKNKPALWLPIKRLSWISIQTNGPLPVGFIEAAIFLYFTKPQVYPTSKIILPNEQGNKTTT
jgi:hypothetical protein